jgi:hypothetical protein
MEKSARDCNRPLCMLAHDLVNKLSVIVGCCDLLTNPERLDPTAEKHVQLIRNTAKSMAERLNHEQCHLVSRAQSEALQKEPSTTQ